MQTLTDLLSKKAFGYPGHPWVNFQYYFNLLSARVSSFLPEIDKHRRHQLHITATVTQKLQGQRLAGLLSNLSKTNAGLLNKNKRRNGNSWTDNCWWLMQQFTTQLWICAHKDIFLSKLYMYINWVSLHFCWKHHSSKQMVSWANYNLQFWISNDQHAHIYQWNEL